MNSVGISNSNSVHKYGTAFWLLEKLAKNDCYFQIVSFSCFFLIYQCPVPACTFQLGYWTRIVIWKSKKKSSTYFNWPRPECLFVNVFFVWRKAMMTATPSHNTNLYQSLLTRGLVLSCHWPSTMAHNYIHIWNMIHIHIWTTLIANRRKKKVGVSSNWLRRCRIANQWASSKAIPATGDRRPIRDLQLLVSPVIGSDFWRVDIWGWQWWRRCC